MKRYKYLLVGFCLITTAFIVALNVNMAYEIDKSGDIFIGNLEALAEGEGGQYKCIGSGDVPCDGTFAFIYIGR